MNQPLDIHQITQSLQQKFPNEPFGISFFDTIDSTNRYLLEKESEQLHICLAEHQTAGRGRAGKIWHSPAGVNLYCSILWPLNEANLPLDGLSLAIGVVVANTLREFHVDQISLKWPNDILCRNKKISGILIETAKTKNKYRVIIGAGINVYLSRLPEQENTVDQPWIDMASVVAFQPDRNELIILFLTNLFKALSLFRNSGFSAFKNDWLAHDAFKNQMVTLHTSTRMITGVSQGIDEKGRLLLDISGKIELFTCGEILNARVNE